jgi:F-type H+-transporting ATPase subunit a
VLIGIFAIVAQRARVVPRRGQALVEIVMDFVRVQVVEEVMGKERAKRYVPFLTTLFLAIVVFNLTGVIPFLNLAATSLIGLPIVMALWVYFLYLGAGVRRHGLGGYLKASLFPPGVPWPIYILLTPVEALQVFILRPATLALRLTANMMAGHLLLALCFAATQFFFFEASGALAGVGAISLSAAVAFTLFEVFVALLQAYVFIMLSAVYLNMAIEDEH